MRSTGRPDNNAAEIVAALRGAGCYVRYMKAGDGFDLLVAKNGTAWIVEVKQPGGKLTQEEKRMLNALSYAGVDYHIVTSVEQALEMIGAS